MEKRVYTTKELAKEAGVTQAYIRQLCIKGEIRADKVGRDWLIPVREAVRWMSQRE